MGINGKIAIVTGASSGIGRATAILLSKNGAKVALVARSKENLVELSSLLPESFVVWADLLKETEIKEMVKKVYKHFGRIDILVNNAGRGYHVPIMQIESKKYSELFDLNVIGPLIAMQQVVPIMEKQKKGVVVNISSGTSLMQIPGIAAYSSLKRALNAISLTAMEELKENNISVCLVYPYITKTNFHKNLINGGRWSMEENDNLPKIDTPEYVAEKILEAIDTERAETFAHDWMKR